MSNGRAWTADDTADLRRLNAAGLTDAEIARRLDRHPDTIRRKRAEIGIPRGQSPVFTAMMARINARRRADFPLAFQNPV